MIMLRKIIPYFICMHLTLCIALPIAAQRTHVATSKNNMVATVNPIATDAGIAALERGGNAIDAAVAAALTLGVVDGFNSGIGGGCFVLLRTANGEIIAIDGREMAPSKAHRDMYLRDGKPDGRLSKTGPLASGVPGALAAYEEVVRKYGKKKFSELILPASQIAKEGFSISDVYAERIKSESESIRQFPATASVLLKSDSSPHLAGEKIFQNDLANTYQSIGNQGVSWFYRGDFAEKTEKWMAANGGILSAKDFANYKTVRRRPIKTTYRGYEIYGFPPPSSGGVHVGQILNILENFDLRELSKDAGKFRHVVAEAMKLAFADRAYWLGDPDYVKVPRGLIDKKYAKSLAAKINPDRTTTVKSHGTPPNDKTEFFSKHTTHVAAADKEGNWVAITTTINTSFGSKVIVPGLGVVMNNQMDDFSIAPGTPNAFGLIGGENNSIAAGKRPLSSMSPTIVTRNGQPIMTVGAAGGPKIITQVVWAIINHIDLKMSIGEAIARPRVHHQWSPDRLLVENNLDKTVLRSLVKAGHKAKSSSVVGITQAIAYDTEKSIFVGAHDPRTPGKAKGSKDPE